MLEELLRDGGLWISGYPEFVSGIGGLMKLSTSSRDLRVIRSHKLNPVSKPAHHPDGGHPPKSKYLPGTTIWKWVSDAPWKPKQWFEFDGKTGLRLEDDDSEHDEDD